MLRTHPRPLARATLLMAATLFAACGPPTPPAPASSKIGTSEQPPTDETACARLCAALDVCHAADSGCLAACAKDLPWARQGLMSSATACTEEELRARGCGDEQKTARDRARRCYLAAMSAYGERDGGASFRRVAESSCRRSERCRAGERSVDPVDVARCTETTVSRAKGTSAPLLLGAASEARIEWVATCVEASPCNEREPISRCLTSRTLEGAAAPASPIVPSPAPSPAPPPR